ncbi:MAG: hypothetical protein GF331_05470 [Chitinivibrionales bacterium]|nr:hypothetical protein [Chitinivibrionales bacterium]
MHVKHWAAVVAVLVSFAAAGLWILWAHVAPALTRRYATGMLRSLGFEEVRIDEAIIGLTTVRLRGVSADRRLSIDSVTVGFSLWSLLRRSADNVRLHNAVARMAIDSVVAAWPPLGRLGDAGGKQVRIPFSTLAVTESAVWVLYRGQWIHVPVRGRIKRTGTGRLHVDLTAAPLDASLELTGAATIAQPAGSFQFRVDHIGRETLAMADSLWPSIPDVTLSGTLHATGRFDINDSGWRARGGAGGRGAALHTVLGGLALSLTLDTATVFGSSGGMDTAHLQVAGGLNGREFSGQGAFGRGKRCLRAVLRTEGLDAVLATALLARFTDAKPTGAEGAFAAVARAQMCDDSCVIRFDVDAEPLRLHWHTETASWRVEPGKVSGRAVLRNVHDGWSRGETLVEMAEARASSDEARLHVGRFAVLLRTGTAETGARGRFELRELMIEDVAMPSVSGTLLVDDQILRFEAKGMPLPEAELVLSGLLSRVEDGIAATVHGVVPRFRLDRYGGRGAQWWPLPEGSLVSGAYRLEGRAVFERGELDYWAGIDVRNGTFRRRDPQSGVTGLDGAAAFVRFLPPATPQAYHFTFDSAYIGLLRGGHGQAYLSAGDGTPVLLSNARCSWAGGTLFADSVRIYPDESLMVLTARFEAVQLQRLIDAFEYQGVRGTGLVFGSVGLRIRWAPEPRVTLLGGSITAGPATGTLSLSRDAARTVLGVDEDFAPEDPTLQEQVTLMILEALQDMLYTQLRVSFESEDGEGSVMRIEIQGRGPRGAVEQDQIPIGGLTINIHGSDRLLNGLLFGGLGGADIEIR